MSRTVENELLGKFGENSALYLSSAGSCRGRTVSKMTARHFESVVQCTARCAENAGGIRLPESEWLSDNRYIAERAAGFVAEAFSRAGHVPVSRCGKIPLVYAAAERLVSCGALTEERIRLYMNGFQKNRPFTEKELSLIFPAFYGALIRRLAKCARRAAEASSEPADSSSHYECAEALKAVFDSFRTLEAINAEKLLTGMSSVEALFSEDKSYSLMDEESRAFYRRRLAELAAERGISEKTAARKILELSVRPDGALGHIGKYLFDEPLGERLRKRRGTGYITLIVGITFLFSLAAAYAAHSIAVFFITLIPFSEIVKTALDNIASHTVKSYPVPRMELRGGIPADARTLAVISCIARSPAEAESLCKKLELYSLANRDAGQNLSFGLLLDLPESHGQNRKGDGEILSAAENSINGLNKKYGERFCLFTRPRTHNKGTQSWCGRERKRGAVEALVKLIRQGGGELSEVSGNAEALADFKYLILLDSDTKLTVGSAKKLVGAMLHPSARPVIDTRRGVVTSGHGIIAPAISVDLDASNTSALAAILGGQGGLEPYAARRSDIYQDVFGRGSFAGKGIVNIEAYEKCLIGRFPLNTVLSHDLPEGEILRCGFAGDIELTDGFPSSARSWWERLHRWTRGDWQNIVLLTKQRTGESGKTCGSVFDLLSKWKVIDNLRRSLVPPVCLLSILAAVIIGNTASLSAGIIAGEAITFPLFIGAAETVMQAKKGRLYRSRTIGGFGSAVLNTVVSYALLPQTAFVCLSAMITAMFRLFVSKKNMLKWITAAESEGHGDNLASFIRRMRFSTAAGTAALFGAPAGIAFGILWILSPLWAWLLTRRRTDEKRLDNGEREMLKSCASEIWRYFSTLMTPERGYLPPDNWQQEPMLGAAERTSPTNIGLGVLSVLSAYELSLTDRDNALTVCRGAADTIERLEKTHGHLYNWYSLTDMHPMKPRYVSTVDSGNFAACLTASASLLRRNGADDLADRFVKIRDAMDFSWLYDNERRLFHIGRNENGEAEGHYDLFASEVRLTSYYACARGVADIRHWRMLSRPMTYSGGRLGLASWNGSVFEYFMPELFLPLYKNSLIWDGLRFCLITQSKTHRPWGMSESAFASADSSGSYRYKAHGAQKLALKRRVSEDCVIAPYASFLSLVMWPKAAVKNLCTIESVCGKGKFGFFEALDYTPARVPADESFVPVKCFMVHHLGMSLTACANAILDDLIVKSFITDPEMAAYTELLQEKGPVGRRVTTAGNKAPDDPVKDGAERWRRVTLPGDGIRTTLVSNGAYSVVFSSDGRSMSKCGGTALTLFEPADVMKYGVGMYLRSDKTVRSLVPAPYFDADVSYSSGFYPGKAVFSAESSFWACETECFIHHEITGEVRKMKLTNTGASERTFELAVYLEPVLSDMQSYISHPAFSKLSVQTSKAPHGITVTRRPGGNLSPCAMNVSVSAPFTFDSSRGRVIGEMGSVRSAMNSPSAGTVGDVLEPCVLLRTSFELLPGESREIVFAISFGENASEAEQRSELLLTSDGSRAASYSYMCSRSLGMTERDMDIAAELLFSLIFPAPAHIEERGVRAGKTDMWKFGISGDLPTAFSTVESSDEVDRAKSTIKAARYLSRMGFPCDLIVLCREKDVYMRSFASELESFLEKLGDAGGIFILNESDDSSKLKYLAGEAGHGAYHAEKAEGGLLPSSDRSYTFSEDAFTFETEQSMGAPAWSHVMTNGRLGWLAADAGTFGMWSENARENRLMPWINDPYSRSGAEQLFLEREGRRISLFAAGDEFGCRITYGPGYAVWERDIGPTRTKVTGFIHPEKDVRVLIISVIGGRENDRILYRAAVFPKDNIWNGVRPSVTVGVQSIEYYDSESGQTLTTGFSQMINGAQNGFVSFVPSEKTCIQTSCTGNEISDAEKAFSETKAYWQELCSKEKYTSPWPELDRYMNFWNMYQILACRIMGRTSLYQSGGAIGFRDQLQDVCSVCDVFPELAKRQILEAASHQYLEGDVMHWWHRGLSGEPDKGVRTRCSDDLLWLAWSAAKYTEITDSTDILALKTHWLVSEPLKAGEQDRYEKAVYSDDESTLFEHCIKAFEAVRLRGTGARGLLKIGSGDWNDGMNLVGADGRGESVWLTFFAAHTAKIFADASERFGKRHEADELLFLAEKWGRAADNAWDGEYYLRGTYDSGALLGSSSSQECRIDSIPQSMAVLSGFGSREKCEKALNCALNTLCDTENGVIKLFDVPFDGAEKPGYISAYLPGVRENGGQYTHAAIWLSMALFEAGREEEGTRVLLSVLPSDRKKEYRLEPYVLAGDIYSNPQNYARGGWSWYTGSAGWFRTAVREKLLPALKKSGVINMP